MLNACRMLPQNVCLSCFQCISFNQGVVGFFEGWCIKVDADILDNNLLGLLWWPQCLLFEPFIPFIPDVPWEWYKEGPIAQCSYQKLDCLVNFWIISVMSPSLMSSSFVLGLACFVPSIWSGHVPPLCLLIASLCTCNWKTDGRWFFLCCTRGRWSECWFLITGASWKCW